MKNKIIEAQNLPEGEKIYLKKDFLGWRVVEPIKNPETGKINLFNLVFGGKKNLFLLITLMAIMGFIYLGFQEQISNYKMIAKSPCSYCKTCQDQTTEVLRQISEQKGLKLDTSFINYTQIAKEG